MITSLEIDIYGGVILQNISVEIIAYVVPFYGVTEIAVNCFPIFKFAMKGGEFSQWTSIYIQRLQNNGGKR